MIHHAQKRRARRGGGREQSTLITPELIPRKRLRGYGSEGPSPAKVRIGSCHEHSNAPHCPSQSLRIRGRDHVCKSIQQMIPFCADSEHRHRIEGSIRAQKPCWMGGAHPQPTAPNLSAPPPSFSHATSHGSDRVMESTTPPPPDSSAGYPSRHACFTARSRAPRSGVGSPAPLVLLDRQSPGPHIGHSLV